MRQNKNHTTMLIAHSIITSSLSLIYHSIIKIRTQLKSIYTGKGTTISHPPVQHTDALDYSLNNETVQV